MKKTLAMYVLLLTVLCSGCGNSQEASTEEKAVISEARTEAKEKTEEVTPETIYQEAIELQSGEKWQEAAILFGSLGDYEDSLAKYEECTYAQAVQYFNSEQYADAFELFFSIDEFDKTVDFLNDIADEEKSKIINEVNTLYHEKEYESAYMILSELLDNTEKDSNEIYLLSEFMKNIQGEYFWWKDENAKTNITKDVLKKNDTEYIIEPYCVYDESGKYTVEATLNGNKEHRLLFVEGEIWIIYKDIMNDWEVWESPEVFEANQKLREQHKEAEKAKAEAQAKRDDMAQKEPAIGMTYDEVRYGAWGEPKDINKTTFAWGTTEQWCYSDYRYVYFTNGIVDAIQE